METNLNSQKEKDNYDGILAELKRLLTVYIPEKMDGVIFQNHMEGSNIRCIMNDGKDFRIGCLGKDDMVFYGSLEKSPQILYPYLLNSIRKEGEDAVQRFSCSIKLKDNFVEHIKDPEQNKLDSQSFSDFVDEFDYMDDINHISSMIKSMALKDAAGMQNQDDSRIEKFETEYDSCLKGAINNKNKVEEYWKEYSELNAKLSEILPEFSCDMVFLPNRPQLSPLTYNKSNYSSGGRQNVVPNVIKNQCGRFVLSEYGNEDKLISLYHPMDNLSLENIKEIKQAVETYGEEAKLRGTLITLMKGILKQRILDPSKSCFLNETDLIKSYASTLDDQSKDKFNKYLLDNMLMEDKDVFLSPKAWVDDAWDWFNSVINGEEQAYTRNSGMHL